VWTPARSDVVRKSTWGCSYPADRTLTSFRRVGRALLWPHAINAEDGDFKEFNVV
jgi:hypothetical protein